MRIFILLSLFLLIFVFTQCAEKDKIIIRYAHVGVKDEPQSRFADTLAKIVNEEDKSHPLSDEEIATKLREMGGDIARRTVTKYRRSMKIPSSRKRKEC